ncbi:hypothetical protein [Mesorhizobium kowhaii]|uniref:Uncharacterized protein n=1 Tax=Mesorhizobium kowhaii TaxID=1300272 RepID=A0A2W7C9W4_9HYPH|nr:hypothetical protein [Mesorhizobium kowhaii]PZV39747.1 hypothetical protein B5V02_07410 [Mesorhizobium kowhaii]
MNRIDNLKARWRPEWSERSDLKRLHGAFHKALHFIESLPAHRAELSKPGTLSQKGLNDSVRAIAAEKIVPELRRGAWEAEKAANSIKSEMSRLAVPKPDKTDMAGAVLRSEIRTMLRSMDHGKIVNLVMNDPAFQAAAFEGPAALSGLTEELRADLEKRMVEQNHGATIEAMDDAKEAIALAQAAFEIAISTVKDEAGFAGQEPVFDKWMATASAEVEREISAERARQQPSGAAQNFRLTDIGSDISGKSVLELEALAANVSDFASNLAQVRIARLNGTAA